MREPCRIAWMYVACALVAVAALWIWYVHLGYPAQSGGGYWLHPDAVKGQVEMNTYRLQVIEEQVAAIRVQHERITYLLVANLGGLVVTFGLQLWNRKPR